MAETPTRYRIQFEQVQRKPHFRGLDVLVYPTDDVDDYLARRVHDHTRNRITGKFRVTVSMDRAAGRGAGVIDGGRAGRFTVHRIREEL